MLAVGYCVRHWIACKPLDSVLAVGVFHDKDGHGHGRTDNGILGLGLPAGPEVTLVSHQPPLSKLCLPSALPLLQSPEHEEDHHNLNNDDFDDDVMIIILILNVFMLIVEEGEWHSVGLKKNNRIKMPILIIWTTMIINITMVIKMLMFTLALASLAASASAAIALCSCTGSRTSFTLS